MSRVPQTFEILDIFDNCIASTPHIKNKTFYKFVLQKNWWKLKVVHRIKFVKLPTYRQVPELGY